jgi:hypothetical protein
MSLSDTTAAWGLGVITLTESSMLLLAPGPVGNVSVTSKTWLAASVY